MSKKILTYLLIIALLTISGLPAFADNIYSMDFSLNKTNFNIDEYIIGTGTVYKNGIPVPNVIVTMVVQNEDGKSVYDVEQYTTDSQGRFNVRFRMVKSVENGTYYIKLKSNGVEKTFSFIITKESIPIKLESITITGSKNQIEVNKRLQLVLKGKMSDGSDATSEDLKGAQWSSSNTSVAVVDNNGLVTGKGIGEALITAKIGGLEANYNVKVTRTSSPPDYEPSPSSPSKPKEEKEKSPIELGLIVVEGDIKEYLTAEVVDKEETVEIFGYLVSDEYYPISDIFDITSSKKLDKPLKLIIKYDTSKVTDPQKLGVYYFNENTKVWEYIGGKVIREGEIEVVLDHLSKYAVIEYEKTFDDISSVPWAQRQIEVLAARHVINGITDKNYAPNNNITRAQFAKLIVEALNLKLGSQTVNFSDVKDGAWYADSVRIAASLGIVAGYDGKFDPDGLITREQMAAMIVRALKQVEPNGNYVAGPLSFADQDQISEWAKEAVAISVNKELVKGLGNGLFGPKERATRAQAAVIIYRMLESLDRL